jgi:hypothetical protein
MFGAIDKRNVDMFKVFCWLVVNYWNGIGVTWRGEEESSGHGSPKQLPLAAPRPALQALTGVPSAADLPEYFQTN